MAVGKGRSRRYESETGVQALSATVPRLQSLTVLTRASPGLELTPVWSGEPGLIASIKTHDSGREINRGRARETR